MVVGILAWRTCLVNRSGDGVDIHVVNARVLQAVKLAV